MRVRNLIVLLLALFAGQAYAATTVATVWIDTDADPLTGCAAAGGISGFERAVVTTIDTTSSMVTAVQRRECAGGAFGNAVTIGGPWAAAHTAHATQAETRIAFADLPQSRRGAAMRLAFVFETANTTVAFTTMPDGSAIHYPAVRPRRRRAARPADGTQALVADGNIADWANLQPLFVRGLHSVWVHGTSSELFFRFDLLTSSQAPVAANDSYAVRQGKSLVVDAPGVLENDSDPEGSDLSAKLVAPAAHGSVTLSADGSFVYNNNGTLAGDGFDYKATDGAMDSNPARVTINVTPNVAPVAQNDTFATATGGTLVIAAPGVLANDSDADGDPLTASVATAPARGTLALTADGSFTYTHNGSTEPSDTFSYTVSDGLASSSPGTVTINVSTTNAPPVAVDDVFHVANGGTLDVTAPGLFTNDLDSDTPQSQWTTTVIAGPTHGTLTAGTGGAFTYVHDGSGASDSFTYRISDGTTVSNIATVTIVAGAVNAAPVANADQYAVDEDATLIISAAGVLTNDTDAEGSALSAVAGNLPTHGTLTLNANGSFTYVPQANYFGGDSFTYAATDGALTSPFTTVTIQVTAVNDAPVNVSDAYTIAEGGTLNVPAPGLLANDSDIDSPTVTAFSTATNATVNADGSFTYVHDGSETTADSFTYETRDGSAATSGVAAITITEVNDAPFADVDAKATAEDTPLTFALSELLANDNAGDGETSQTIAFGSTSNVQHGLVSVNAGNLTFTPDADFAGTASFRYSIIDNGTTNGASDPQTATALVTVTVSATNDAPVANADALTTNEDESLTVAASTLTGNDHAGANEAAQTIAITAVSNAVNGAVSLNGGNVTFVPTPGFSGTASFTYTITDSGTTNGVADPLSASATVTITVSEINDAPVATADAMTTAEDAPLTFAASDLTGNDSPGALEPAQSITVTSVGNAVNGTVSLVNGTISFIPAAHFAGTASFSYTITDNGTPALTATATVTIAITEINEAPVATDDAKTTSEDTPLTFPIADLLANDNAGPNEATQTLTLSLGSATNGTVSANGGNITFTPAAGFNGTASFGYTITDNGTTNGAADPLSDSATVTITVADVNDAPVATADAMSTGEDAPLTFAASNLTTNDSAGTLESAQTVTVTAVANAVNGTVSLANGNITFTPNADFFGVATFDYTIADNGTTGGAADAQTATATVTITVTEVNDTPAATSDAKSAAENTTLVFAASDLVTNDNAGANEAAQTITVTSVNNATNGTVSLSGGNITFVPSADFNGTATFEYTITDNGTTNGAADPLTVTATVTITISEANAAPVASDDAKSAVEDVVLTFAASDLTANDTAGANEAAQTLTVTSVSNASSGTVSLSAGTITFTPAADFNGSVTFDYTITDNGTTGSAADPRTDVGTVTISVSEVNDAPGAVTDSKSTDEDVNLVFTAADLLANDTKGAANESAQTLTVTGVSNATNGTVGLAAGVITFTPDAHFNGAASFDYTLTDNGTTNAAADAKTASGTVNVTVREVNDSPVATADAKSVAENATLTFAATDLVANDNAGPLESAQTITVTSVASAANGTVDLTASTITFTPDANFNGTATFEYTITDNGTTNGAADAKTATATVTITVSEVNAAPVATADTQVTAEDAPITISAATLLANDTNGANEAAQTITITGVANGSNGTVALSGSDITFTPTADFYGTATFNYTITDNGTTNGAADPKTATATVTVTVTEINDAPAAASDAKSVAENGVLSFTAADLLTNDAKGANEASQTLTVTAVSNATNGTVDLTSGTVTFTPSADFNGTASFDYTITDDGTTNGAADPLTSTATVTVTVSEVNAAPVATDDAKSVNEDGVLTFAAADLAGNDSQGANETAQTLTVTAVGNASNGTVVLSSGNITFTPAAGFNGTATFDYTVTDNGTTNGAADAKSDSGTVTVTVAEINDAPVATDDTKSATEDAPLTFAATDLLGNDTKGASNESAQTLSVTGVTNPTNGTVTLNSGNITFTPNADFYGTASFDYSITDDGTSNGAADAKTDSGTVTVTVAEINDTPTANNDTKSVAENGTLSFPASDLAANDTKGANEASQTLTVTAVNNASSGSVTLVNGTITVTPDADFNGTITFDYTMTDDGTTSGAADPKTATATVTVTVSEVNDAPVAGDDSASTSEDNPVVITAATLLGNDTKGAADEGAQTLTITAVGNAVNGTVTLVGTNITFTPAANYNGGATTFEYTVTDDGTTSGAADAKSDTGTVTVTVSEVNDAPAAVADTKGTAEDTPLVFAAIDLLTNDSKGAANESAQTLTVTAVSNPSNGTVGLSGGNITFTPTLNFNGTATFNYTIADNGTTNGAADAKTASGTVTVNVSSVNDLPVAVNDPIAANAASYRLSSGANLSVAAAVGLLANDSDVDGPSALTVSATPAVAPARGTVTLHANGSFDYTRTDFTVVMNDTFTYTVSDGANTATAVATISFNSAPVAVADTIQATEDTELVTAAPGVRTNDTDTENNITKVILVSGPSVGTFTTTIPAGDDALLDDGSFRYLPPADYVGPVTFTYKLQDAGGLESSTVTATINVAGINDAPFFTPGAATITVTEDSAAYNAVWATTLRKGPVTATDETTQTLTFTAAPDSSTLLMNGSLTCIYDPVNGPDDGIDCTATTVPVTINGSTGALGFRPAANRFGTTTVAVFVTDSGGTANGGANRYPASPSVTTFNIVVTPVNDPPSFTAPHVVVPVGTNTTQTVSPWATNISQGPFESGQALTFEITNNTNPALFATAPSIDAAGTLTYRPTGTGGFATITVRLRDDNGTPGNTADDAVSTNRTFDILVGNLNDAPVITVGADITMNEDTYCTVAPCGSSGATAFPNWATAHAGGDDTGQTVSFTTSTSALATVSIGFCPGSACGTLYVLPTANRFGSVTFTVNATDNGNTAAGGSRFAQSKTFTLNLLPVNDPPTFTATNLNVSASTGNPTTHTFANWITGITVGPFETAQALTRTVTTTAGANLFTAGGLPAVDVNQTLTFTTAVGAVGTATVQIVYTDDGGTPANVSDDQSTTRTYTIGIGVNSAPSFTRTTPVTVSEDSGTTTITNWATAVTAGTLPEEWSSQTVNFVILSNSNPSLFTSGPTITSVAPGGSTANLQFTVGADRNGSATLSIVAQDNGGTTGGGVDTSAAQSLVINVSNINDPPTFTVPANAPAVETAATNTAVSVSGFAVGSAGPFETGSITYVVTANSNLPLFATPPAIAPNGTLSYTVLANQTGTANITVKANDGSLDSVATQSFTITVVAAGALTPVVPHRTYTTLPQMKLTVSAFADGLLAGITDPTPAAGTPLVVKAFANVDTGATFAYHPDAATGQPNGTFSYTPAAHFVGTDNMTYTVCDGTAANAKCSTANLNINMTGPVLYFVDDDAAVGGDGSLLKPWKRLDAANNSRREGATIFVLSGTYAGETGLTLKKNETVVGQGVAGASFDAYFGITPPTAGSLPTRPLLNGAGITTPIVQLDTVSSRTAFTIERVYSVVQGPTTERVRNFNITGGTALNWQVALPTNVVAFEDVQVTNGGITLGKYGTATIKNVAITNGKVNAAYMDGLSASFENVDINNNNGTMALEVNWSRNGSMVFDATSSIQVTNTPQQALMIMDSRPTVSFQFACPITLSGGRDVLYITGDTITLTGGPNVTFTNTVSSTVSDSTRWAMYTSIVNLGMSSPTPSTFTGGRGVHLDRIVSTGTGIALGSIFASTSLFTDTSGQPITVTGGTINSNNGSPSQPCFTIVNAPNVAVSGVTGVNCTP